MILFIPVYFLLFILTNVSSDSSSSSFCLCALKDALEEYALFTTDIPLPRYYSGIKNDVGFFIGTSSQWKPVNDATWPELAAMINAPAGMYTQISIDGIHPVDNGLQLNNVRTAHLAQIIATYRSLMRYVHQFHEKVIKTRSEMCKIPEETRSISRESNDNNWREFFLSHQQKR